MLLPIQGGKCGYGVDIARILCYNSVKPVLDAEKPCPVQRRSGRMPAGGNDDRRKIRERGQRGFCNNQTVSRTRKKQHHAVTAEIVVFLLLFFLLTGTVLLRFRSAEGTEFSDLLYETQTEEEMSEERTADEADAGEKPDMEIPDSSVGQPAAGENAAPDPEEDVFLSGTESASADSAAPAVTGANTSAHSRKHAIIFFTVFSPPFSS